jgi:hypothetical protein
LAATPAVETAGVVVGTDGVAETAGVAAGVDVGAGCVGGGAAAGVVDAAAGVVGVDVCAPLVVPAFGYFYLKEYLKIIEKIMKIIYLGCKTDKTTCFSNAVFTNSFVIFKNFA